MRPKTVREWIVAFPVALQTLITANATKTLDRECHSAEDAIDKALRWMNTKEGANFWHGVHSALGGFIYAGDSVKKLPEFQTGLKIGMETRKHLKQLSAETAIAEEAPTQQAHNMHSKYSDQPVAQITAVFGTDVSTMSASDCLNAIKSNNAAAKALTDTGITGPYVDEQVNNLKAANEVLLARLNSFVKAPTA